MPEADNARRMLECETVVKGKMGSELAEFLIDYLPFETEHRCMLETIRLVLQPGLIADEVKAKLWSATKRKNTYYIGFMDALPDNLPDIQLPHPDWQAVEEKLGSLQDNPLSRQLSRCLSAQGQAYLRTARLAFNKPNNQDVAVELFKSIQQYFSEVCPNNDPSADIETIIEDAEILCEVPAVCPTTAAVQALLAVAPEQKPRVVAMLVLSWVGEALLNPIFGRTDSIGSVMRKKIAPVTEPILEQIAQLQSPV